MKIFGYEQAKINWIDVLFGFALGGLTTAVGMSIELGLWEK